MAGADLWQQYQEWFRFKRLPRDVAEAQYTVTSVPALPAPRNTPQPLTDDELAPF
jgi:hypothetical protein